jgi:2-polyprenyl-3-methyl-5-hydroxy-6-metoxy-1,4-benzoquinol methylase
MSSRFDEAAQQWDGNPVRVALARGIGEAIQRAVPIQPHWRALDYGAGTGLLTLSLLPKVASVTALDASKGMLEQLSRKISDAGISNVDARFWNLELEPFTEGRYDLVVSSMTLHHLRDVPLVMKRLAALLNPGGWIALADLDAEDGSFHGQANDVFHHGFDRQEISGWLSAAGFSDVKLADAYTVAKPSATGEMRDYGVFLATGRI